MMRQYELVDRVVSYDPVANEDLLNRAYVYATQKHGDQKRASGDPYYSHPVEVAGILTDLHLDTASIATALLHDTIEDTDATFGEIEKIFGKEIADMVNGVTKMSLLELSSADAAQAENFRKLLLATASDVRILLVKLADRLHNMRTLHFISSEKKRRRIAQETLDIYAPLAGRIGMQNFREELEDLAFAEVNIEGRDLINERLSELKQDSGDMLEAIAYEFSALLGENGIKAHVHGRQKRPFSIWRKMQNKSISLEQLSDVFGYRVVVADEAACYQALGVLHRNFSYVPGRYKDYISTPKLNGYQSLHTTVIGPNQQRVEVQIRTEQMHEIAEKGVAAHWAYKDKQEDYPDIAKIEPFNWLQDMVAQLKNGGTAEEFLENTKLELFNDQVFCFTPKGRLIAMPRGATALDFAYAVHTEIGNSCIGVRINGLKLPFRTMLKNGDEIEIVRGEDQLPSESWLNHVQTGKARAAIRHALREHEAADFISLGRQMVDNLFAAEAVESDENVLDRALGVLSYGSLDDLLEAVGRGSLSAADVLMASLPKKGRRKRDRFAGAMRSLIGRPAKVSDSAQMLPLNGAFYGTVVKVAEGFFPLPGDEIVGIVTPGQGVVVYPANARELAAFEDSRERWVPMQWGEENNHLYASRVDLTAVNRTGSLSVITQTIADFDANITNLSMIHLNEDFCDLTVDVEVRNKEHMEQLVSALQGSRVISKAKRVIFGGSEEK
ncbi:bifunctional (p)ppGpp synthetase/guanosine-3',5'-bis(diphosphate) 3'-pyrophosphohydrolase [Alphaproteobacteria bacterium]|nr:bifunctional (p)ppGpp synthetase/guanosine-3',5'-bis(diphosphate) 3'-pyrophosphohydrolase [Alphaproteobacteria bacterium]MDA8624286.1 bifunctional (p)ppGpp synthetase/guanosine-3',5'-bis(diphosphate) 3'-pyrophosphohydrolase [Alphaproteobacteria bacterium]MDA8666948.1 bifunctional (p)ppGpp synthetase/guanosine-3',5'-bis(diphosphate) 3'-pyrophosphohydrolase [Alphaproteobacteria bacterium]MDB2381367.1 bifunctional (p)ppGpp synthetase/guanosine-3',5'-bis(diphosphate) 3'-pyrophosphohydrolase [Alph